MTSNDNGTLRYHQQRASLLSLLTWFSSSTASSTGLQHRVRRPHRSLAYQHVVENMPRGLYEKFWIPSGETEQKRHQRRLGGNSESSELERFFEEGDVDQDNETFWSFSVRGDNVVDELDDRSVSSMEEPSSRSASWDQQFRKLLYDQFIGEDNVEGGLTNEANSTANVTTEVRNSTLNETFIYTTNAEDANQTDSKNVNSADESVPLFQPLRIRAILAESTGNGDLLTAPERDVLFHDLLSPALLAWSNTLRVDPVVGNLTVDAAQLVDGETCGPGIGSGLPSIRVPTSHMTEGVPDTDMIVYLSLDFVVPRLANGSDFTASNETDASEDEPTDEEEFARKGGRRLDRPNGKLQYLQDMADVVIGLTNDLPNINEKANEPEDANKYNATMGMCSGDYLAAASFCSTDQYDRPTAALLHICIDEDFFDPARWHRNIMTLMHELGHALGFNSLSMAHFRKVDGTPYTERIDGDVPDTSIECTGPQAERRWADIPLPSDEILHFRQVRGGVRVAEMVTPSVLQAVRNQFGCQELTGAELESGERLPLSTEEEGFGCLGDHWERRLFSSDLMNPVVDDLEYNARISTLTLAYFADSGWYQVDLSGSRVASGWGRGAGCGFVNEACIGRHGEVPPQNAPFFCNEIPSVEARSVATEVNGCTPDLSRKAVCSMGHNELELPWEYQYFHETYGSYVGGSDALMDYCPVFSGYENGLCSNPETEQFMQASQIERFGVRNSRCLVGNLHPQRGNTALCLPIACVVQDQSLRVKIDHTWHFCQQADQKITDGGVTVVCPDPRRICPTFYCPYDCLGTGGQCDYDSGKCLCEYEGRHVDEEPILQACGIVNNFDEPEKGSSVFLRSAERERNDPALPHPDSPLNDYYVPTERALQERDEMPLRPWMISLILVSGAVLLSLFGILCWSIRAGTEYSWATAWFRRSVQADLVPGAGSSLNKDKMIATVLVEMRMRDHNPDRLSVADTDEQLTESEASQGAHSEAMSDYSSRRSETLSEVDISPDVSINEIAEDEIREVHAVRRRRILVEEI